MKLLALLIFLLIYSNCYAHELYSAYVQQVTDGDTLDLLIDIGFDLHKKEKVRVYGIDTPESRTKNLIEKAQGLKSKNYVKSKIEGKSVEIEVIKREKYGRLLVNIFYMDAGNRINLGQELILRNMAREYYGDKKEEWVFDELPN